MVKTHRPKEVAPRTRRDKEVKTNQSSSKIVDAVWAGRIVFSICLITVATVLGCLSYFVLSRDERKLAESQFESIAERALVNAQQILKRRQLGTVSCASIVSNVLSDPNEWPFVALEGYEEMATNLIETTSGRELAFAPMVHMEEREAFEEFAYNYFENVRQFPEGTGESSFGRGIWGRDITLGTSDNRYHDTHPNRTNNSPYEVFFPLIQLDTGPDPLLMFNLKYQATRSKVIDGLLDCSKIREPTDPVQECGALSDFVILQIAKEGPGAVIYQPVYPAKDRTKVSCSWEEEIFLQATIVPKYPHMQTS